jgi:hypothetical protein
MKFVLPCLLLVGLLFHMLGGSSARAASQEPTGSKPPSYQSVEVSRFGSTDGLEVPAKFLITLTNDVMAGLKKLGGAQVLSDGAPSASNGSSLKLTATVTGFQRGSRALRYMVPGVGKTQVKAHIRVSDRNTGQILYESDVDGKVLLGPFGGDSMGAANGLANEVVKKVQKQFFPDTRKSIFRRLT